MSKDSYEPLTVDDVVVDIKKELGKPTPDSDPVSRQLDELQRFQQNLRETPVVGSLLIVKELFFSLIRSPFVRQFQLNDRVIALFTALDNKINQHQMENKQEIAHLYHLQRQTNPNNLQSIDLAVINQAPTQLTLTERLLLYSFVRGLKPNYCLEIGTDEGGTAAIICAAMDQVGGGQLITIDPTPGIAPSTREQITPRTVFVEHPLPEAIEEARNLAAPFDFILYKEGAVPEQDIEAILPHLANRAYILIYNCYQTEVRQGIEKVLHQAQPDLVDCGILASETHTQTANGKAQLTIRGGLRLIRFERS